MAEAIDPMTFQRLLDVEAIRSLLARYCRECDSRTEGFVRRIFTEDATDDHGLFGQVFSGWDEIEQMYQKSSNFLASAAHFVSNEQIEVAGDAATCVSYVQCFTWLLESEDKGNVRPADYVFVGWYEDTLRRTPDGWRISGRVMHPLGTGALGLGYPHPVYFAAYQKRPAATSSDLDS